MANRHFNTYQAWRRACRELCLNNGRDFEELLKGDKDIANCYICGVAYGEWDGASGIIEDLRS